MQLCNFAIFVSESIYFHKALQEQADKKLQFLPEGEFVAFMKVVQRCRFPGYVPTKEETRAGRWLYTQITKAAHNKKK